MSAHTAMARFANVLEKHEHALNAAEFDESAALQTPEERLSSRWRSALLRTGFEHQGRYSDVLEWRDALLIECGHCRTVRTFRGQEMQVPVRGWPEGFFEQALEITARFIGIDKGVVRRMVEKRLED